MKEVKSSHRGKREILLQKMAVGFTLTPRRINESSETQNTRINESSGIQKVRINESCEIPKRNEINESSEIQYRH